MYTGDRYRPIADIAHRGHAEVHAKLQRVPVSCPSPTAALGDPAAIASTVQFTAFNASVVQLGMSAARVELPLGALLKEIELVGSFRFVDKFTTAVIWLESGRLSSMRTSLRAKSTITLPATTFSSAECGMVH